ncbi:MAG TPA: hypothetical protein VN372_14980 [Methanospirillum sp.]|nr:hypothetical protein [Methanospirillum sp.]
MNRYLIGTLLVSLLLVGISGLAVADASFQELKSGLKQPVAGVEYKDDAFRADATEVIESLSNRTVPTGRENSQVYGAYSRLRGMSVSPEFYPAAYDMVAFLYYTAKAGEAYEEFHQKQNSMSSITNGDEYYQLAENYYEAANVYWDALKAQFPSVTVYTLPSQDQAFPEDEEDRSLGTILPGMKHAMIMMPKEPNTTKAYDDEDINTTAIRWFEDNVQALPKQKDLPEMTVGYMFIHTVGVTDAKTTYMNLIKKNVSPEYYNIVKYIDAFFYMLYKSKESYDQYVKDRTSMVSISDGQESYDKAYEYYDDAETALGKFKGALNLTNTTLPEFPSFEEVESGPVDRTQQMLSQWEQGSWYNGFN